MSVVQDVYRSFEGMVKDVTTLPTIILAVAVLAVLLPIMVQLAQTGVGLAQGVKSASGI
jgi:hypothetical protein